MCDEFDFFLNSTALYVEPVAGHLANGKVYQAHSVNGT